MNCANVNYTLKDSFCCVLFVAVDRYACTQANSRLQALFRALNRSYSLCLVYMRTRTRICLY